MNRRSLLLVALTVLVAVFFVAGLAMAAEATKAAPAKDKKAAEKTTSEKDAEAEAPATTDASKATLDGRLKDLQAALEEASAENWGTMPAKITDLTPYLGNGEKDLVNPESGKTLAMNPSMARQHEKTIREPAKFITFYSNEDTPDKGRAAIYATGEIKYLKAEDFQKALAASKVVPLTRDERLELREANEMAQDARRSARGQGQKGKGARKGK